jgi:hypothetical protein
MGTYSNVAFAMHEKDYKMFRLIKSMRLPERIFSAATIKENIFDKDVYWIWKELKWYGDKGIEDLDLFMDLLDKEKIEYGYIQCSEDRYDSEKRGDPYLFYLYTTEELKYPLGIVDNG